MTLYLSRLRVSRDPSFAALSALIDPVARHLPGEDPIEKGRRTDAHHRLVWSAFAGDPAAKRDFLWRNMGDGVFLTLSARPPSGSPLFGEPEIKEFAPGLTTGDRLAFQMRVNATHTVKVDELAPNGKRKRKHRDVVMEALYPVPADARADLRLSLAETAASDWMAGQGERAGFALDAAAFGVENYSVAALPGHVGARKGQPQYGILDLTGILTVTDPMALLGKLAQGFGRARAFGCGLMLIRRA